MPADGHVTDPLVASLTGLFERAQPRLAAIINDGLRRGLDAERLNTPDQQRGDATHAYRVRQQQQAHAILAELRAHTDAHVPIVTGRAYRAGAFAVDRTVGDAAKLTGTFGGVHVRATEAIATNLGDALHAAIDRTGQNIAAVFDRADALEAGVPPSGIGGMSFLGRRVNDPYRNAALEQVGQGFVAMDTRKQVSTALARRLVTEGTTDALTGFVDRSGRRWGLDTYTRMVARTTTREAVSRGTVNRLRESGNDLVEISSHPHNADECTPYDGQTFSLDGATPGYDVLDQLPPFHPNCLHVVTPAGADLANWENEVADQIGATEPAPPPAPAASKPAQRIRDLIDTEKTATRDRYAERFMQHSPTARADAHAAADAGTETPFQRSILEAEAKTLRDIPLAGLPELDETSIRKVGADVRKLAERRAAAVERRIQKVDQALTDKINAVASRRVDALDRIVGGPVNKAPSSKVQRALEHPDIKAADKEIGDLVVEQLGLRDKVAAARGDAYRQALSEVRPGYGTGKITNRQIGAMTGPQKDVFAKVDPVTGKGRPSILSTDPPVNAARHDVEALQRNIDAAERNLPREWIEASNAGGDVRFGITDARAWHKWVDTTRHSTIRVRPGDTSTVLHELGHRMEHVVTNIRSLEADFYRRRTAGDAVQRLKDRFPASKYDLDELFREDKFTRPYIGKAYGADDGRVISDRDNFEVLTMGLQGIFHDEHDIIDDPDLRDFILGLLAAA